MKYRRILLKLSGEALMGSKAYGIDPETISRYAHEIKTVVDAGAQVGIVIGGGNIFRGLQGAEGGMDRVQADHMGMLATVINGLALQSSLEISVPATIELNAHVTDAVVRFPKTVMAAAVSVGISDAADASAWIATVGDPNSPVDGVRYRTALVIVAPAGIPAVPKRRNGSYDVVDSVAANVLPHVVGETPANTVVPLHTEFSSFQWYCRCPSLPVSVMAKLTESSAVSDESSPST
jgi:hypothetical protein